MGARVSRAVVIVGKEIYIRLQLRPSAVGRRARTSADAAAGSENGHIGHNSAGEVRRRSIYREVYE